MSPVLSLRSSLAPTDSAYRHASILALSGQVALGAGVIPCHPAIPLPRAFFVRQIMITDRSKQEMTLPESPGNEGETATQEPSQNCLKHDSKPLEWYCFNCGVFMSCLY